MRELLILGIGLIASGLAVMAGGKAEIGKMKFEGLAKWGGAGLALLGICVLAGIGIDAYIKEDRSDFRVTAAELTAVGSYAGPCPGAQLMEASVTTEGGSGEITYRLFTEGGFRSLSQTRPIKRDGTISFDLTIRVGRPTSGAATARDIARLRILSPRRKGERAIESPAAPFSITCQ